MVVLIGLLVYVACHVWTVVPLPRWGKSLAIAIWLCCFLSEFLTFARLADRMPMGLASAVYNIGNKTIIITLYILIAFLLLDLGRLLHIVPRSVLHDNIWTFCVLFVALTATFIYGSVHYHAKKRIELILDSNGRIEKPVTLVLLSDLHVGYHNRRSELARWIDMVNNENPDYVLIAGDIIDFSLRPVEEENMAEEFRRIKAPVYACLGNHEYISGKIKAKQFYDAANIHLLVDTALDAGPLTIVGRDDRSNSNRQPLNQIVPPGTSNQYTILLDHQPYHLEEAEKNGIDFQFSGHTHRGQVWPISWIVDAMYECSWGSHQRGSTRYYVSSGIGIWGAKYRIGTQSEYVVATIK